MPDLNQERIAPQKMERSRARMRLARILPLVATSERDSLTPSPGDPEERALDKYWGALAAAADQLSQAQSYVSVLKHGADPTGVEDSAQAFRDAIEEAARYSEFSDGEDVRQGGVVFVPAGNYLIGSTLVIDRAVVLRGEAGVLANGPNVGILWGSKLVSAITNGTDVVQVRGYGLSDEIRSTGLYDLSVQGSGQDRDGINYEAEGPSNFRMSRVSIRGCGRTGVRFDTNTGSLAYSHLDQVFSTSNAEDGFFITQSYGGGNAVGMRLSNCYSASNGRSGYRIDGLSQSFFDNCVENDSGGVAWYIRGTTNCFVHCFAEDAAGPGLELYQARANSFLQFNIARCSKESVDGLVKVGLASYGNQMLGFVLDLPAASAAPHLNFSAADASWNSCLRFYFAEAPVVSDSGSNNLTEDFFNSALAPSGQTRSTKLTSASLRLMDHGLKFATGSVLRLANDNYLSSELVDGTPVSLLGLSSSGILNLGVGTQRINLRPGPGGLYLGAAGTTASIYVPRLDDATSGATTKNSNNLNFEASYWNGSAASTITAGLRHSMDATTPSSSMYLRVNGVDVFRVLGDGRAVFGSNMSPDTNAEVTITSTSRGFMLPRLTSAQRDAMTSPADGIMLFNSTTSKAQVRAGGSWVDLH